MSEAVIAASAPRSPLLWGLFCACSWTWCIGMYLPVLLIDRFGWNGFVAFAVPNVLGCSAMAFVLSRRRSDAPFAARERSKAIVAAHRSMMLAFSLVTVAFQVFFTVWLLSELIRNIALPSWGPLAVGSVVYGLGMVFAFLHDRDWLGLAICTYCLSLVAAFVIGVASFDRLPMQGMLPDDRLWWLVPTLCFGFLLCPYLDLTFHRAAQSSSQPRVSFVIFGIAFAIMLGLTVMLWFSPNVWHRQAAALAGVGHILTQLIFTCGAHLREARLSTAVAPSAVRVALLTTPLLLGLAALPVAHLFLDSDIAGEWTYLTFLGCYGLLFPAYVMIAIASRNPLGSRAAWGAFAAIIMLCAPLFAMGFLLDQTWWLVPPVAMFIMLWMWRGRGIASDADEFAMAEPKPRSGNAGT